VVLSTKDNYLFVYDGLYDMTGSAQDFLSVSHLFGRGLDELTCKQNLTNGYYECLSKQAYLGRVLIDGLNFIFTNWLSTIQHECMGHGFRAREFKARINRYVVTPFHAYVDFHREDLPYYGLLIEETAGSESNTVFSRESFRQSLLNDYSYHYYFYSFVLKIDLGMYVLGTPKVGSDEWNNPTHWRDINRYINAFVSGNYKCRFSVNRNASVSASLITDFQRNIILKNFIFKDSFSIFQAVRFAG
jgi:hypothetical protein